MTDWLINGLPGTHIAIADRGLQYGDGVFETIAVRAGSPRFLDRHLARLRRGCDALGIGCPAEDTISNEVRQVASQCDFGAAKIIITRGGGPRGYAPPVGVPPTRMIGIATTSPSPPSLHEEGIVARLCDTRISPSAVAAGMKTLSRTEQVMARAEWQTPNIHEGIMCDLSGHVISGTMSNLFFVVGGRLHTPRIVQSGIAGIMRQLVMEQAEAGGDAVIQGDVTIAQLLHSDELFMTNSLIGMWPVQTLLDSSGATLWTGSAPEQRHVSQSLRLRLVEQGVVECGH